MTAPTMTVIIPIRVTDARIDLIERIRYFTLDTELPPEVDFLVVDDGSSDERYLKLLENQCNRLTVTRTGARYYQDFSPARARNHGARHAKGRFLMFLDADLAPYPGFFQAILREVAVNGMVQHVDRFLMCPVIYLTENGQELFQSMDPGLRQQYFVNAMLSDDKALIEKYSSGTSAIVVDRFYYLSRGGQDEGFQGWGYEDFEFTNRLIRRNRKFQLPENWSSMAGNFMSIQKYEGWKAVYRLYGDWLANKGMYLFHMPHAIETSYHAREPQNLRYLASRMEEDRAGGDEPPPLCQAEAGRSLLLRKNPFCYDREFAPFLGAVLHASEDDFEGIRAFRDFLKTEGICRVVFPNPYANEKLLALYRWCRKRNFPHVVCERGALPDSVFHDPNGFLNDSSSYDPARWEAELDAEQRESTLSYIQEIRNSSKMLEAQSGRQDITAIRSKLGIRRGQKVLLVPFQQPRDTVVRYFCGEIGSFQRFRERVQQLADDLGDDWCVIYKKHPTEDDLAPIPGAIAAHDFNIYDLIELSDAVAVINSGVGIYAMMFGKPLYVFGASWYSHEGLCRPILADEDAGEVIRAGFELDYERVLRFVHHLRFRLYSFGKMTTRRVRYTDGTPITATSKIAYYEIRGWTENVRKLPASWSPTPTSSLLFDRYRHSMTAKKSAPPAPAKPAPKPTPKAPEKKPPEQPEKKVELNGHAKLPAVVQASPDEEIRKLKRFQLYSSIYSPFLGVSQKQRLLHNPSEFFRKASAPASLLGKRLVRKYL